MSVNLEGLNFNSKLSTDDLIFWDRAVETAILRRIQLLMGSDSFGVPKYGVVDEVDPQSVISSETTRPLLVSASTTNPLFVNITAGTAVTPNGAIIRNSSLVEDFELARTAANDIVVVYLENEILDTDPTRITRFLTPQKVRRTQSTDIIRSALLSDFNNSVLFTPERLSNIVVLAVITVVSTTSGLELQFDYTDSNYSFNRPWFSAVDIEHRSSIGSGTPTSQNPHGLTFNDLVSGNLTLYDQLLPTGLIQARDDDVKGVPGTLCEEVVTVSRIVVDSSGSVTSKSRFGGAGSSYITLSRFPVWVNSFYLQSHKGRAIAFDWIPGTRTVVLPSPETLDGTSVIQYNEAFALQPPQAIVSNTLTFGTPNSERELVFTAGVSLDELANNQIAFDGAGPIPRDFRVYVKEDGSLLRSPEIILAPILVDDLGTSLFPISFSIFGPAKIKIGLADANTVSSMNIVLRISGINTAGSAINEDLTFSGSTWVPSSLPGSETASQFVQSANTYQQIQSIQVISRTDDGPNAKVIMYAELETETTRDLNRLARVALVKWDGTAIGSVVDERHVVRTISDQNHRYRSAAEMSGLGGSSPVLVLSEDLAKPRYRETVKGTQVATNATFEVLIADYTQIQAGDTINFGPTGKTVTAITSGVPVRATGQYLASSSNNDTALDLKATIEDATFASGLDVEIDTTNQNQLNFTVQLAGAQGNGAITEPVEAVPDAIAILSQATGGIDTFGENFTPRHLDQINSTVPSVGTYNTSGVRSRYQSRAIPIGAKRRIDVVCHEAKAPYSNLQVRIRVSPTSSSVWQPWEVMTQDGAVFTITKTNDISKIQLQLFGECSGFSVYERDP